MPVTSFARYYLCRDCAHIVENIAPHAQYCLECHGKRLITHQEITSLNIAHIDSDSFYAAIEKRDNPALASQPVIVGGRHRGVVAAACYIARIYGIRSAMPIALALKKCPHAVIIPPNMAKYRQVSYEMRKIFMVISDIVEPLSFDEAYLDLQHCYKDKGNYAAALLAYIANKIEYDIGITVSIGLSYNKFLAKLASDMDKPRGFFVIGQHDAKPLLATMPVNKLWGVGAVLAQKLRAQGYYHIGDIQQADAKKLQHKFGKIGAQLWQFAHGEDNRNISSSRDMKSISTEITLDDDTDDDKTIKDIIRQQAHEITNRMMRYDVGAYQFTLKFKKSDFTLITRSHTSDQPTINPEKITDIGYYLYQQMPIGQTIRLIGFGAHHFIDQQQCDNILL